MMATRIATTSEAPAATCAGRLSPPRRANSVMSGSAAKTELASSESPTGSNTCVYASTVYIRPPPRVRSRALHTHAALFITCFNDTLFPSVGRATVDVLERLGCSVEFPEAQTCCGQM